MANAAPRFEELITNNAPVQESIMRNLTPWEFRNLQLAGVRILVSRKVQRKHLTPNRCSEKDPENQEEICTNTTKSFEEIRACAGHPLNIPDQGPFLKIGDSKVKACLHTEPCRVEERLSHDSGNVPDNEPNTEQHPIHTKVCKRCRDFYAAEQLNQQLLTIAHSRWPLCKDHSLALAMENPLNACRCLAYINDRWRCKRCTAETLAFLETRAFDVRQSIIRARYPLYRPWTWLRILKDSPWPLCPVEGCYQPASLDEIDECMQLCLCCNTIVTV